MTVYSIDFNAENHRSLQVLTFAFSSNTNNDDDNQSCCSSAKNLFGTINRDNKKYCELYVDINSRGRKFSEEFHRRILLGVVFDTVSTLSTASSKSLMLKDA